MKYMLRSLKNSSFKRLFKTINDCSEKSGKSKIYVFFDMVRCFLLYQAGYVDYELFSLYDLSKEQRATILTRGKNNEIVKMLNPKEYWNNLEDKNLFNQKFKKLLNREFFTIDGDNFDEFKKFIKGKKFIFVKPLAATGGHGIEKIEVSLHKPRELYDTLLKNGQVLLEEVAVQHEDINKLHPTSVNTVRVVTIRNKYGVTSIVAAVIRMGTGYRVVDNFHSHGIYCPIDVNTGKITGNAYGRDWKYYEKHPTTGIKFIGYQIPKWDEVKKLAKEAADMIPELGYIGWDICIGPDKPCLIEGNQYPGYDLYRRSDNFGVLPEFEKALNRKK